MALPSKILIVGGGVFGCELLRTILEALALVYTVVYTVTLHILYQFPHSY